jgi:transcriptional regulator with XRE-family HTH domain
MTAMSKHERTAPVRAEQPYQCRQYGVCVREYRQQVLREARQSMGLSLAAVARRMGINRGTLANFETGRYPLSVERLEHYAQIVGVPWEALIPPSPLVVGTLPANPAHPLRRLVAFAQAAPPYVVHLVIELLEYHARLEDCPLGPHHP